MKTKRLNLRTPCNWNGYDDLSTMTKLQKVAFVICQLLYFETAKAGIVVSRYTPILNPSNPKPQITPPQKSCMREGKENPQKAPISQSQS